MPVIFCLFLGVFMVLIAVNIKRFIDNERSPVVTENAWLRRKRDNTSIDANGVMHSTLSLVFEVEGGTLECVVPGRVYRAVREGANVAEELGDVLFAAVKAARFAGVDPEDALNAACEKFIRRYAAVEQGAADRGVPVSDLTLAEMTDLWNGAKQRHDSDGF